MRSKHSPSGRSGRAVTRPCSSTRARTRTVPLLTAHRAPDAGVSFAGVRRGYSQYAQRRVYTRLWKGGVGHPLPTPPPAPPPGGGARPGGPASAMSAGRWSGTTHIPGWALPACAGSEQARRHAARVFQPSTPSGSNGSAARPNWFPSIGTAGVRDLPVTFRIPGCTAEPRCRCGESADIHLSARRPVCRNRFGVRADRHPPSAGTSPRPVPWTGCARAARSASGSRRRNRCPCRRRR